MVESAEKRLFRAIVTNPSHVLHVVVQVRLFWRIIEIVDFLLVHESNLLFTCYHESRTCHSRFDYTSIVELVLLVLHHALPKEKSTVYNLRSRAHNFELPWKDTRNFLARQLYSNIYCPKTFLSLAYSNFLLFNLFLIILFC